jgi:UDP-N-acetylmuramyl tripeptide synthase
MLASILAAAGLRVGLTSTDGIVAAGVMIEAGDYSGPGGGRRLLREPGIDVAILETARGGMLRRGLTVARADAAAVTNVAEDHLGEFGVHDAAALAEVKLIVARAIDRGGALVLNADDVLLRERTAGRGMPPPAWCSLQGAGDPAVRALLDAAPCSGWLEAGVLVVRGANGPEWRLDANEIPATRGGAARHNVSNALVAMLLARALDAPEAAVASGLRGFDGSSADNPGRGNERMIGGVRVILDFAHNPHGLAAMVDLALALPAGRRHIAIGQAGDRDDASIRALARVAARLSPVRVVIKEMTGHLRGRTEGEVPALIEGELRAAGIADEAFVRARSEVDAAREAMRGASEGDLVLLLVHSDRNSVVRWLDRLEAGGWQAGAPIALPS